MPFQNTIIIDNTANTIIPAISGFYTDLLWFIITNTSATGVRVDITLVGGIPCSFWLAAKSTVQVFPPAAIPSPLLNTAWTAQCSASVTDVRVFVSYLTHI